MTRLEKMKNDILVGMRQHLDSNTMAILKNVILTATRNLDVIEVQTLPATVDNTNQYIKELFMAKKAPKLSEQTVGYYMNTIDELITFTDKSLIEICEADIELYLLRKKKQGNSNTSLNNLRRNISAFYTWMRKTKIVNDNPCDGVEQFKQIVKQIDHLEAAETEEIKSGCKHKRDRAIIEVLRSTAMRRGEVVSIKVNDIDFSTGKITVFGHKSGKFRNVFLDGVALKYVKDYLEERGVDYTSSEPLFTVLKGDKTKALTVDGLYVSVKTIARRSGIKHNIYPHLYRKTCATSIVRRGGSDEQAGLYLGHAPKGVTAQHYVYKDEKETENVFRNYVAAV